MPNATQEGPMLEQAQLISKVLVLDDDETALQQIKAFCDAHQLVCVKTTARHVMAVLRSNVDLGAIFLSETYVIDGESALSFADEMHAVRPELPIFLRREAFADLHDLDERARRLFSGSYTLAGIDQLLPLISETIFSLVYPNALVRGISEITKSALESQFMAVEVLTEAPYIVRDRIIYGELFTLIPLESNWCRGYMMFQAEEAPVIQFVDAGHTHIVTDHVNFRDINHVLGEVTNLVWGAFKNRYITHEPVDGRHSQVPIIVNHQHRYISFGSEDPQLCFKYTLADPEGQAAPLVIYQRFVFNLSWTPEKFKENEAVAEDLFDSGELEMF
jgi:hypothetical protein